MTDYPWDAIAVQVLFGVAFVAALALTVAGGRWLHNWMARSPELPSEPGHLDDYDYAYLAGGVTRVVYAGLTRLYLRGAITTRSDVYEVEPCGGSLAVGADVVEHEIFAALSRGKHRFDQIQADVSAAVCRFAEARLRSRGVLIAPHRAMVAAWGFVLLAALPVAVGFGLFGYNHYRLGGQATNDPVTIIAFFASALTLVACLCALQNFLDSSSTTVPHANERGQRLVEQARQSYRKGRDDMLSSRPPSTRSRSDIVKAGVAVFEKPEGICNRPGAVGSDDTAKDAVLAVAVLGMEECADRYGLGKLLVSLHQPVEE